MWSVGRGVRAPVSVKQHQCCMMQLLLDFSCCGFIRFHASAGHLSFTKVCWASAGQAPSGTPECMACKAETLPGVAMKHCMERGLGMATH